MALRHLHSILYIINQHTHSLKSTLNPALKATYFGLNSHQRVFIPISHYDKLQPTSATPTRFIFNFTTNPLPSEDLVLNPIATITRIVTISLTFYFTILRQLQLCRRTISSAAIRSINHHWIDYYFVNDHSTLSVSTSTLYTFSTKLI